MKKYIILIIFCIIFLSSCLISINDVNYRFLNKKEKLFFTEFHIDTTKNKLTNNDSLLIQEITADNLKRLIKKNEFTCVYIWKPYCSGTSCMSLDYYSSIQNKFSSYNFNIIIVSLTYNIVEIKKQINNSNYQNQIYVIKYNENYGNNIFKVYRNFVYDFSDYKINKFYPIYFYYKDTNLLHTSDNINTNLIDSLLKIN